MSYLNRYGTKGNGPFDNVDTNKLSSDTIAYDTN